MTYLEGLDYETLSKLLAVYYSGRNGTDFREELEGVTIHNKTKEIMLRMIIGKMGNYKIFYG